MKITEFPKILIINPPHSHPFDRRKGQALGIAYIASFLREKGYHIELLDSNQKETVTINEIVNLAHKGAFHIVGISVFGFDVYNSMEIAKKIKDNNQDVKIVIGGHHATATHLEILKVFPAIDIVVRGEGEKTFYELVKALKEKKPLKKILGISYRENGQIRVNPMRPLIKNLDEIPFPARNLLPSLLEYGVNADNPANQANLPPVYIVTSRGCTHKCSFCSIPAYYSGYSQNRVRMRSAVNIVDEIEEVIKRQKKGYIDVLDDNFLKNMNMVRAVIDELKTRNIKLPFYCTTRADQVIQCAKDLPFLKENGMFGVELGVESGNDSVLKRFNKGITVEQNKQAIRLLEDNDIGITVDFIMFDPRTTINELVANIIFLEEFDTFCFDPQKIYNRLGLFAGTSYGDGMRRSGKWTNIQDSMSYEFEDKNVDIVYEVLIKFACSYQLKIDQLTEEIISLWAPVSRLQKKGATEIKRLEPELYLKPLELRRIPRSILKRILIEGKQKGFDNLDSGEIFKSFVDKIVQCENFIFQTKENLKRASIKKEDIDCQI